jgi:hypothetical protein
MDILLLLFLLIVKHSYADFTIQTYLQTVKKGVYRDPVGISHSVDHIWTSMLALLIYSCFYTLAPWLIICIAVIEGAVHYHIDWIKVRFGSKDNTKQIFWTQFGLDQLAHHLCYLYIAWYVCL